MLARSLAFGAFVGRCGLSECGRKSKASQDGDAGRKIAWQFPREGWPRGPAPSVAMASSCGERDRALMCGRESSFGHCGRLALRLRMRSSRRRYDMISQTLLHRLRGQGPIRVADMPGSCEAMILDICNDGRKRNEAVGTRGLKPMRLVIEVVSRPCFLSLPPSSSPFSCYSSPHYFSTVYPFPSLRLFRFVHLNMLPPSQGAGTAPGRVQRRALDFLASTCTEGAG